MKVFIIFFGLIAATLGCTFRCPNSRTPVRNLNFSPVPNGCGPKIATIPNFMLPNSGFTQCCNNHDRCYGTCNSGQASCDSAFLSCMTNTCSDGICRAAANTLYGAVRVSGCPFYLSGQRKACLC